MINYKLAKKLKEAGFPQIIEQPLMVIESFDDTSIMPLKIPTLSELIEATDNNKYFDLERTAKNEWCVCVGAGIDDRELEFGKTPEEAVAKLWLKLQKI